MAQLQRHLSSISEDEVIVFDLETHRNNDAIKTIMGIGIWASGRGFYIPVNHTDYFYPQSHLCLQVPQDFFAGIKAKLVAHNAKFDVYQSEASGGLIMPRERIYDTMLMAHYVQSEELSFKLDHLTNVVYKTATKATKTAKAMVDTWDDSVIEFMGNYCIQDCRATHELFMKLWPLFVKYDKLWTEVDRPFMYLLMKMEERGMLIDTDLCSKLEIETSARLVEIEKELGFDPSKKAILHSKLFSPEPVGLGLLPYSLTPRTKKGGGGNPQVNKEFFENTEHPVVDLLQEYSTLKKQVTSYFRPYLKHGEQAGVFRRVHTDFRQAGTKTGRPSSSAPNVYQVPRDSKVKDMFCPEENCELIEIDYSNMEMRLMTVYTNQPKLKATFSSRDGDVHQLTADETDSPRHDAKQGNFTIGYGGGWKPLNKHLKKGEEYCRDFIKSWHKSYPEVREAQDNAEYAAKNNNGTVRMWTGRDRVFRYPDQYWRAFNSIVQGGAFEIMKRTMLKLDAEGWDIRNSVYDSVWLNVPVGTDIQPAIDIMEEWVECLFGLPFYVDSKILRSRA